MQITNPALQLIQQGTMHATPSPQLAKAANAFEANFLGELLKPLREDPLFGNGSGLGGDSLGSGGAEGGDMGTVSSLASEALAQAIAKRGGFGIARMVLAQLSPEEETASQTATTALGPQCGGCAQHVTIGPQDGGASDFGSVEMLARGNLPAATGLSSTTNGAGQMARRAASSERRGDLQSMKPIRVVGPGTR